MENHGRRSRIVRTLPSFRYIPMSPGLPFAFSRPPVLIHTIGKELVREGQFHILVIVLHGQEAQTVVEMGFAAAVPTARAFIDTELEDAILPYPDHRLVPSLYVFLSVGHFLVDSL